MVISATSLLTAVGGLSILLVRGEGPYPFAKRPFSFRAAAASLRNRDVVLANLGYIGHMWELYAMWAWVGALIATLSTVRESADPGTLASLLAFLCIGVGALGCLAGGWISDRFGRAQAALTALVFSGGTAAVLAVGHDVLPFAVVIFLCAVWGFWVIADSAQFSALVTERATPEYVGGALSLQLAAGYAMTALSLWLVPFLAERVGWSAALGALVLGPVVGGWAMATLVRLDRRATNLT